jgi:hypothetical protein
MKQLFLILLSVGVSTAAMAQKKDSTYKQSGPLKVNVTEWKPTTLTLTDSTMILSLELIGKYSEVLKDQMTARQFEAYMFGLNKVVKEAIAEWNRKQKGGK